MKKQTKQLIALLIILAVCVCAYFGIGALLEARQDREETDPSLTVGALSGQLASLTLSCYDETLSFTHSDSGWAYSDPAFPVDQDALEQLALQLTPLTAQRVLDSQDTLAAYGLSVPLCTVTAVDEQGASLSLLVGDETPSGGSYAMVEGTAGPLYVLEDSLVAQLTQGLYDFMEFDQFDPLSEANISSLSLTVSGSADSLLFAKETKTETVPADTPEEESTTQTSYLWALNGVSLEQCSIRDDYLAAMSDEEGTDIPTPNSLLQDALAALSSLSFDSCIRYQAQPSDLLGNGGQEGDSIPLELTIRYTDTDGTDRAVTLLLGNSVDDGGDRLAMKEGSSALYTLSGTLADPLMALALAFEP